MNNNEDIWMNKVPTIPGNYWCKENNKTRIIKIWKNKNGTYTNEDGGASINDIMYNNTLWYGPIKEPK